MLPQGIKILGFHLNLYYFFYALGSASALLMIVLLGKKKEIPTWFILGGAFSVALVGWNGASLMETWGMPFIEKWLGLPPLKLGRSFTIEGIIFGCLGAYIYLWGVSRFWDKRFSLDPVFISLPLCQAIGRLGCFSAGCCHGKPAWGVPWAVTFKPESACIYKGIPVHPTQLYEASGDLILFLFLLCLYLKTEPDWLEGKFMWLYLLGYGLLRFIVEFFRGTPRLMIGPLSVFQLVSLLMMTLGGREVLRGYIENKHS